VTLGKISTYRRGMRRSGGTDIHQRPGSNMRPKPERKDLF
jgi:hypothetical protein